MIVAKARRFIAPKVPLTPTVARSSYSLGAIDPSALTLATCSNEQISNSSESDLLMIIFDLSKAAISGCRTSNVSPLDIWTANGRKGCRRSN